MKPSRTTLLLGTSVAVLGLVALVGGTIALLKMTRRDTTAPIRIQRTYEDVRNSDGHLAHLSTREVECRDCHAVVEGAGSEQFSRPGAEICTTCHQGQVGEIHVQSDLGRAAADCLACHDFINDRNIRPWNCIRCHQEPQGFVRAIETHAEAFCQSCHRPHDEPSLVPRGCGEADCHGDIQSVRHGSEVMDSKCLDCHQVHDHRTEAADRCADCHLRSKPRVSATAVAGGHSCTSCHQPHQFSSRTTRACASCHGNKDTLAASTVAQHNRCKSCHAPHDPAPRGDRSCRRCHDQVRPQHGNAPECLGCHPVHDARLTGTAVACSTCHDKSSDDRAHAGDLACQSCHPPHRFGAVQPAPRACTTCHPAQVVVSRGTGHAECSTCHGSDPAHRPVAAPACATCHAPQARTLTAGHGPCTDCHDPHRGATGSEPACASCHRDRARGHHASIAGGCQNCHRAHGPTGQANPPRCQSCHPAAALPALHQVPRHQQCASCHNAHEQTPRSDRATCITCHQEQKDHEPNARICSGCHLFTRSQP